jgi:hypothetical protein
MMSGSRAMSAIYPLILLFATGLVWVLMAWQNARLVHLFWQRLPHVAQQELPGTLDWHPEKTIFFFRRRAVEVGVTEYMQQCQYSQSQAPEQALKVQTGKGIAASVATIRRRRMNRRPNEQR